MQAQIAARRAAAAAATRRAHSAPSPNDSGAGNAPGAIVQGNGSRAPAHASRAVAATRERIPPPSFADIRADAAQRGRRRRRGRTPLPAGVSITLRLVALLVIAAVIAVLLRVYVVQPFWIPSESMEPTLHGCSGCDDDRLLVDKLSYRIRSVHRGDVVVFHRPVAAPTPESDLIKRVIGLPGETVSGHGGRVYVGQRPLIEPYVNAACHGTADFAAVVVPAGDLFVMGDNRCNSTDSRVFGPIKRSSIVGRAVIIVWPLSRIHWL
jgi:signal peptidase I